MGQTCQSVVQYDREGRRQIYTDLKDIQEQTYPQERCERAASEADLCVVCNINFARGLLGPARRAGKPVATDVHAIADLDAPYEQEFLQGADIIFMSNEHLPKIPEEWANAVLARFPAEIVVIGLGAEGALLATRRDGLVRLPAVQTRAVVNTIGAGDALFAGFLDGYLRTKDPYASLRRAMVFASWKIGVASAGAGFADCDTLERIMANFADRQ
jgi:ribokinase